MPTECFASFGAIGSVGELSNLYSAFFAAHVALVAIALPLLVAFLLSQSERYSPRVLPALIFDRTLLALAGVLLACGAPASLGLFVLTTAAPGCVVAPATVGLAFLLAALVLAGPLLRTARVVQPAHLLVQTIKRVRREDWRLLALASKDRTEQELSPRRIYDAFATPFPPLQSSEPDTTTPEERATRDAAFLKFFDEQKKRQAAVAAARLREDPLAASTGIALRSIDEHDIWTVGTYANAVRDTVVEQFADRADDKVLTGREAAEALAQLVLDDHFTPLFRAALAHDARATFIVAEAVRDGALELSVRRPLVVPLFVATLDRWLDDAVSAGASEELLGFMVRALGVIGLEAGRWSYEPTINEVARALAHAGEVLPDGVSADGPSAGSPGAPRASTIRAVSSFSRSSDRASSFSRCCSREGAMIPSRSASGRVRHVSAISTSCRTPGTTLPCSQSETRP